MYFSQPTCVYKLLRITYIYTFKLQLKYVETSTTTSFRSVSKSQLCIASQPTQRERISKFQHIFIRSHKYLICRMNIDVRGMRGMIWRKKFRRKIFIPHALGLFTHFYIFLGFVKSCCINTILSRDLGGLWKQIKQKNERKTVADGTYFEEDDKLEYEMSWQRKFNLRFGVCVEWNQLKLK